MGPGGQPYPGQLWAGPGQLQTGLFGTAGGWLPQLNRAIMGEPMPGVAQGAADVFQTGVADPMTAMFQERLLPQLKHLQAGVGGIGTGAAMRGQERLTTDFMRDLMGQGSQFVYGAEQAARQNALGLGGLLGSLGEQQRGIQQGGLGMSYQDWLRQQPENLPFMQWALSFLGMPTTAVKQPGTLENLASSFMGGLGSAAGGGGFG